MGKVGSRPTFSDLVIESTRNQGTVTVISKSRTQRRLGDLLEKKKKEKKNVPDSDSRNVDRFPRFVSMRALSFFFGKSFSEYRSPSERFFRERWRRETMDRPRRPPLRKRVLHLLPPVLVTFVSSGEAARRYYVKMALDECTGLIGARDWTRRVPLPFSLSLATPLGLRAAIKTLSAQLDKLPCIIITRHRRYRSPPSIDSRTRVDGDHVFPRALVEIHADCVAEKKIEKETLLFSLLGEASSLGTRLAVNAQRPGTDRIRGGRGELSRAWTARNIVKG